MKTFEKGIRISSILGLVLIVLGIVSCGNNRPGPTAPGPTVPGPTANAYSTIWDTTNLTGAINFSTQYHCGWMDLQSPFDFKKGDILRIGVATNANKVLIRILPLGGDPATSVGVVGPGDVVNGVVIIKLNSAYRGTQISVHGGSNPFGIFKLDEIDHDVKVLFVTLIRKE